MPASNISDFLSPRRILLDFETSSRKKLFEAIAEVSSRDFDSVNEDLVYKTICERERLGSTGLGEGLAVPHGRIPDLDQPIISIFRLKVPIEYDAPDELPIWLAVGLLVPEEATDMHLQLFSMLVTNFRDADFLQSLKNCDTASQVDQLFVGR